MVGKLPVANKGSTAIRVDFLGRPTGKPRKKLLSDGLRVKRGSFRMPVRTPLDKVNTKPMSDVNMNPDADLVSWPFLGRSSFPPTETRKSGPDLGPPSALSGSSRPFAGAMKSGPDLDLPLPNKVRGFQSFAEAASTKLRVAEPLFEDILVNPKPYGVKEGKPSITFSEEDIAAGTRPFKHSIVAKFTFGRPDTKVISQALKEQWKLRGKMQVAEVWDARHLLIILENEEDTVTALASRFRRIGNALFRLFRFSVDYNPKMEPTRIPIWIRLPNINPAISHRGHVAVVVNSFGSYLDVDSAAKTMSSLRHVRVCVELDVTKEIPSAVWIDMANGAGYWQEVQVEGKLSYCGLCKRHGHKLDECRRGESPPINAGKGTSWEDNQGFDKSQETVLTSQGGRAGRRSRSRSRKRRRNPVVFGPFPREFYTREQKDRGKGVCNEGTLSENADKNSDSSAPNAVGRQMPGREDNTWTKVTGRQSSGSSVDAAECRSGIGGKENVHHKLASVNTCRGNSFECLNFDAVDDDLGFDFLEEGEVLPTNISSDEAKGISLRERDLVSDVRVRMEETNKDRISPSFNV